MMFLVLDYICLEDGQSQRHLRSAVDEHFAELEEVKKTAQQRYNEKINSLNWLENLKL